MFVDLTLPLFGKPAWELGEGVEVTPEQLRDLAEDLHARLTEAADVVEKLTAAGWEAQTTLYDISLSPPGVDSAAQAVQQLRALGIDPRLVDVHEREDEEEFSSPPADAVG
jgi:hypothetical protein